MTSPFPAPKALIFDYGNTLIAFGPEQIGRCEDGLAEVLAAEFGPFDRAQLRAIRAANRMAPYEGDPPSYRENNMHTLSTGLIEALYGRTPSADEIALLTQARLATFLDTITAPDYLHAFLDKLSARFRLGLLSNYPLSAAIYQSLAKLDLERYFEVIVVSGDVEYAKPHPKPFKVMLDELGIAPEACLFVGDNWLADVQGAKRAGMQAAHLRQYAPAENFTPQPGDLPADLILTHLTDLEAVLEL